MSTLPHIDHPSRYQATAIVFLILGFGFCAIAWYYHHALTEWEANQGFLEMWTGFWQLYDWGGIRAVVGCNLVFAGVFFAASLFAFVTWLRRSKGE